MAGTTKQGKVPDAPDDESMDLSAGFVLKNTSAACESAPEELTPDSFMTQQLKPATACPELTFDEFMARQAPAAIESGDAGPIDAGPENRSNLP